MAASFGGRMRLENCLFTDIERAGGGAGVLVYGARVDIINSTFINVKGSQGAISLNQISDLRVTNSTFIGNQGTGGAVVIIFINLLFYFPQINTLYKYK